MKSEFTSSNEKCSPYYIKLQNTKKQLRNHVQGQIYENCFASICDRKYYWSLYTQTILFCLIECPNFEYKIGYKNKICQNMQNDLKEVPKSYQLDSADVLCIKEMVKNQDSLWIKFKAEKQEWKLQFASVKLCDDWYSCINQSIKINKNKNQPKSANFKISQNKIPADQHIKYYSCITPDIQKSAINSETALLSIFKHKFSSHSTRGSNQQSHDLLRAELKRIYSLQLDEQDFIAQFMNLFQDLLSNIDTLKINRDGYDSVIKSLLKAVHQLKTQTKLSQKESTSVDEKIVIQPLPIKKQFSSDVTDDSKCSLKSVISLLENNRLYSNKINQSKISSEIDISQSQYIYLNELINENIQGPDKVTSVFVAPYTFMKTSKKEGKMQVSSNSQQLDSNLLQKKEKI